MAQTRSKSIGEIVIDGRTYHRLVGIRHRQKRTKAGEARPTELFVLDLKKGKSTILELGDEQEEYWWMKGKIPAGWKKVGIDTAMMPDMEEYKELVPARGDSPAMWKIPTKFADGFTEGTLALSIFGGSGGPLNSALTIRGEEIGAAVYLVKPKSLKEAREKMLNASVAAEEPHSVETDATEEEGDDTPKAKQKGLGDAEVLVRLFLEAHEANSKVFVKMEKSDLPIIELSLAYNYWKNIQSQRIALQNQINARVRAAAFMNLDLSPANRLQDVYAKAQASDAALAALVQAETTAAKALERTYKNTGYDAVFDNVPGIGPKLGAAMLSFIGPIERFHSDAALVAYFGLHVLSSDGKRLQKGDKPTDGGMFPRRRAGTDNEWTARGRTSFFNFAEQIVVYKRGGKWGQVYNDALSFYRTKHPFGEIVVRNGKEVVEIIPFVRKTTEERKTNPNGYQVKIGETWCHAVRKVNLYEIQMPDGTVRKVRGIQRYYDAHLIKQARWRMLTRFVRWLYDELNRAKTGQRATAINTEIEKTGKVA